MRPLSHRRAPAGAAAERERGVIVMMVALSIVSVLLVASLAVDGSQAYSQRRRMQNAADASSMEAARILDQVRLGTASWPAVDTTASSVATKNAAEASSCTIITGTGASLGACSVKANVLHPSAAGVQVIATDVRPTTFGSLIGRPDVTARSTARATIQTLKGTGVPFVVCGNPSVGGYPILNPDGTVNVAGAAAMGTIDIQSSQVPTCGAGSAFKGKIGDGEVSVPGWVTGDNGNGYEQEIDAEVLGATPCASGGPFTNCDMLVPIADHGIGNGNSISMHVVAWVVFHITGDGHGNPKYQGTFQSTTTYVSNGTSTDQAPSDATIPRLIRLIG